MGDSSGEEFYSAPESDGEEQPSASSSTLEAETQEKLSLGEHNTYQSGSTSNDKNTHTAEEPVGFKDNTRKTKDTGATVTSNGNSPKQEYVSGLDNRFVSDDHEVVEGDKVELSEEQIKVSLKCFLYQMRFTSFV